MEKQDQERHEAERIMRRAEELGHDPERVARAVGHRPPEPAERQPVMEVERRSGLAGRVARLFARRS